MGHAQLSAIGRGLLALLAICCLAPAQAVTCTAQSGPQVSALVELYTADNCATCLPADRWLSTLAGRPGVLAFALHVDSGDYTGTRRGVFQRQRKLTVRQRMALVYTPLVLVQGRTFHAEEMGAIEAELVREAGRPARGRIDLEILSVGSASIAVRASASAEVEAVLYLASFERQAQRRLILEWLGPLGLRVERELALVPGAAPGKSGVAAFVQERHGRAVLQTLALPACNETFGYIRAKQHLPVG